MSSATHGACPHGNQTRTLTRLDGWVEEWSGNCRRCGGEGKLLSRYKPGEDSKPKKSQKSTSLLRLPSEERTDGRMEGDFKTVDGVRTYRLYKSAGVVRQENGHGKCPKFGPCQKGRK